VNIAFAGVEARLLKRRRYFIKIDWKPKLKQTLAMARMQAIRNKMPKPFPILKLSIALNATTWA
jgi:hypothetical protein